MEAEEHVIKRKSSPIQLFSLFNLAKLTGTLENRTDGFFRQADRDNTVLSSSGMPSTAN